MRKVNSMREVTIAAIQMSCSRDVKENIEKMKKRLTKSLSDRKLFGICGGIAQYLDVDSTFIRVIYVVLSFCTAIIPSIILYLVLNFIIPEA